MVHFFCHMLATRRILLFMRATWDDLENLPVLVIDQGYLVRELAFCCARCLAMREKASAQDTIVFLSEYISPGNEQIYISINFSV
jgi:hypothetical protein